MAKPRLAEEQGRRIRFHRERQGLSLGWLAEATGMSRQGISKIEMGKVRANDSETLAQIADALGVSRGLIAYGG